MSVYMTEEEQVEALKKWWQQYSSLIIVIISCIMLSIAAYQYWNWHHQKVTQEASNAYEHLMVAFSNKNEESIHAYANRLIKEHPDTIYAAAAHMTLAKLFVADEQLMKAKEQLQTVVNHSKMPALKQVAQIRLARILFAEKKYDNAMNYLNEINDAAFMPVINELKGDVFAAKKQYSNAVALYQKALEESQTQGIGNLFLEMKTNELAAFAHSSELKNASQSLA